MDFGEIIFKILELRDEGIYKGPRAQIVAIEVLLYRDDLPSSAMDSLVQCQNCRCQVSLGVHSGWRGYS